MSFNLQEFKAKRNTYKWIGVCVFIGGLIFLVLDMETNFPTPVRGAYAMYWILIVVVGAEIWAYSKHLPLEETIGLADTPQHRGELRITEIINEMRVDISTAEKIVRKLEKKGYVICELRGDITVWVFPNIKEKYSQDARQQF